MAALTQEDMLGGLLINPKGASRWQVRLKRCLNSATRKRQESFLIIFIGIPLCYRYYYGKEGAHIMAEVVVSSKYQIVIPAEVRKSLSIKKGQKLQLIVENDGIRLIPTMPLSEMRGFLRGMDTKIERDEEERF
jgi:AbrB family looped-hinge helix DNA binding protein